MKIATGEIFDTDEHHFERHVIERSHETPVLVDFWADWCPPCRRLTPVLERLAQESDVEFVLAKVEVDDNMHLAGRYQLRGFPTAILFQNGEEGGRFAGFKTTKGVLEFFVEALGQG